MEAGEILIVNRETAKRVLERFGDFHDAVVRRVEFEIEIKGKAAVVELDAQDGSADWAWRRVRFVFANVEEWRFERINAATEVIFETSIHFREGLLFVSFDGKESIPLEPSDEDMQWVRSRFFVAAQGCECRVAADLIS